MKVTKVLGVFAAATMLASAASAATIAITEGNRPQIDGTTVQSATGTGLALGSFASGETGTIFGRVFAGTDVFLFDVLSSDFSLNFVFDGVSIGGSPVILNGLQAANPNVPGGRSVQFTLTDLGTTATTSETLTADITTGNPEIFGSFGPGSYSLAVSGLGVTGNGVNYDIQIGQVDAIAPIPLPAAGLLLLAGLGGLGVASRRRKG